ISAAISGVSMPASARIWLSSASSLATLSAPARSILCSLISRIVILSSSSPTEIGARICMAGSSRGRARKLACCRGDAGKHVGPIAITGLAEQAGGRIPGAVVAIEQPSPVRDAAQRDEDRTPERSRQMSGGGVAADHQVKILHDGGRIDESS